MNANVEIKARVEDPARLLRRARELSDGPGETLVQEDTFFRVPRGRLKLRVFEEGRGELIYYERGDQLDPGRSRYHIHPEPDPRSLARALGQALGVRAVVRKRRQLFLVGRTRIHVDEVEGLGHFTELEVVLEPGESPGEGVRIAGELMQALGIRREALVEGAYVDLLEARG